MDSIDSGVSYPPVNYVPWIRPSDWPILPTLTASSQQFSGLVAVFNNNSNFIALQATTSNVGGTYTVNWGDGTASASNTYTSGTNAYYQYTYTSSGLGSLTNEGYKTAVINVTASTGNLIGVSLQIKHNQSGLNSYVPGWLDIVVASPNINTLAIGGATINSNMMQQATIVSIGNVTNFSELFYGCSSLQSIGNAFSSANVTNCQSMFQYCSLLRNVPLFNTGNVANMGSMFASCLSLATIPLYNTSAVTNFSGMFNGCSSLTSIPQLISGNVTNTASMFVSCPSLITIPLLNTASVTNMIDMFSLCSSLSSIPLINTAAVQNMTGMFDGCSSLPTIPLINCSAVTNCENMFLTCFNLSSIPLLLTGNVVNFVGMFNGCVSLPSVPALNCGKGTNFLNMFTNCFSLSSVAVTGVAYTISYASCNLSNTSLITILNNLTTAHGGGGQTITITGNWGDDASAGLATAITGATTNNWTVTH